MTIEFTFAEVLREIQLMTKLAEPLLEPNDLWKLERLEKGLRTIQSNGVQASWSLPQDDPLKTKLCNGSYERSVGSATRKGSKTALFGELSFIWEILPIPGRKGRKPPKRFVISGIASSKARLVEQSCDARKEYVSWRMEVGDNASPGTFFHIQVGEDDAGSQVYQPLPVPRIPCPPITPLLALEYLLAELFQNEWPERLRSCTDETNAWRNIQLDRYKAFMSWQEQILSERSGSVIVSLKEAKPSQTLLTGAP